MTLDALDFEEIRQLLARYCHCLDLGDIDGAVACFTPDGSFESLEPPAAQRPGKRVGAVQLRNGFAAGIAARGTHSRHWVANTWLDSSGDSVRAASYCLITRDHGIPFGTESPSAEVVKSGIYFDRLAKVDGAWLIADRRFRSDAASDKFDRWTGEVLEAGPKGSGAHS